MKNTILFLSLYSVVNYCIAQEKQPVITPKKYSYQDFPESSATSAAMKTVSQFTTDTQLNYHHDVKYITRDGMDLHLQIIQPVIKGKTAKLPCIVYVQGSGWARQNVYGNLLQIADFARRGYTIAIVEYRPSDLAKFPAQLQDAKTAIRFMRKNASVYNVDTDNIFIWGDSSGGHTALMVGLTQNVPALDTGDMDEYPIEVNAVIDFYGPTDITQMNLEPSTLDHTSSKSFEGRLLGGVNVLDNKEAAAITNPIGYITSNTRSAPILIMHGSKDRIVPFKQSVLIADQLARESFDFQFYRIKGADHGSYEFWTKETFDLVESFIKKYRVN